VFIHIPKNSGKYLRNKITNDKNNKIIKSYWGYANGLDLAHIPYMKKNKFIRFLNHSRLHFFAYTRCPYDRIISAYFYINPENSADDFKSFLKTLPTYNFIDYKNIHYYPQYLFATKQSKEKYKNF